MSQPTTFRITSPASRIAAFAILAVALMVAVGAASAAGAQRTGKPTKNVAREAQNAALGKTILTTTGGRTLYSLSAEKNGRFICTGSCLSIWHPLVVPTGVKPTGPVKLGTISRPDGRGMQVTYKGRPLYRFGADAKAGDVGGEGIKDVGTWHAAVVPTAQPAPEPQPPAETPAPYQPPYPYGY
jgi:predicted lipoprotein with Yx(FWY)xxD motif